MMRTAVSRNFIKTIPVCQWQKLSQTSHYITLKSGLLWVPEIPTQGVKQFVSRPLASIIGMEGRKDRIKTKTKMLWISPNTIDPQRSVLLKIPYRNLRLNLFRNRNIPSQFVVRKTPPLRQSHTSNLNREGILCEELWCRSQDIQYSCIDSLLLLDP